MDSEQHYPQDNTQEKRKEFILSCLPLSRALAAKRWHFAEYDDIVQIAMLTVVVSADRALAVEHPYAYIWQAMMYDVDQFIAECRMIRRPRSVARGQEEDVICLHRITEIMEEYLVAPSLLEQKRDYSWLYALVERLPPAQREALAHHFALEGYGYESPKDIALRRNCSHQAVTNNQRYALDSLRKLLSGQTLGHEKQCLVSERQHDIAQKLASGMSVAQIAKELGITHQSIYAHMNKIRQKREYSRIE